MGDVSDITGLLRLVSIEKRLKIVWAVLTMGGAIGGSIWTVSWKMNDYIHEARHENERLREAILVMDKKVEKAEMVADDAKATADKALLYAQLTHKGGP